MRFIKENNQESMLNWKQFNAKHSMAKERSFEDSMKRFDESTKHPMYKEMVSFIKTNYPQGLGVGYDVYVRPTIFLGDVLKYSNVYLDRVDVNSSEELAFWLKFEVENPRLEEYLEIKKKMDEFKNIPNDQWTDAIDDEFEKLLNKEKELNPYIPDFTYCYIQELPQDKLPEIIDYIKSPNALKLTKDIEKLEREVHKLQYQLDKHREKKDLTDEELYEFTIEYWKKQDELEDIKSSQTPSEETLAKRAKKYNKPYPQYRKEQDYMINLLNKK
jgi:hypothetical protein